MHKQIQRWRLELEEILKEHSGSDNNFRFSQLADADRWMLATASCFDDEPWEQLGLDFNQLEFKFKGIWGEPMWRHPAPRDPNRDFFAESIEWPPSAPEVNKSTVDTSQNRAHSFADAQRVVVWNHGSEQVYVALELLDNTRIRTLVVGVLTVDE